MNLQLTNEEGMSGRKADYLLITTPVIPGIADILGSVLSYLSDDSFQNNGCVY